MAMARPSTPPRPAASARTEVSAVTPEQVRRMEINRLKAKELREQRDREAVSAASLSRSNSTLAGQKRSYTAFAQESPTTSRDARSRPERPLDSIQPARGYGNYVEYDFSKMTDTKGGFLTTDDDPLNKAMQPKEKDDKPTNLTQQEWEMQQRLKVMRTERTGPFEPGINAYKDRASRTCRECSTLEVDWKWLDIFDLAVCHSCKEKCPDKYSLLTKSECKEDYLLTDPELKDEKLLPHLERPNPHKSNWHNMFLYMRCQIEDYAFSEKRWGSAEALDAEFAKREEDKKRRKESKFKSKLADLKKRTRVEAYQRARKGGGANFGDELGDGKHVHDFGRAVDNPETGTTIKQCQTCGLEVEEIEL